MKVITLISVFIFSWTMIWSQENGSIVAKQVLVIDTFYNTYIVKDEYRWMENLRSEETQAWVKSQNKVAKKYLLKASTKTNSKLVINRYAVTEYDNPVKDGNYYFTYAY